MGLFSRKQQVRLEEFCGEFYDKNILAPVLRGVNLGEIIFQTVYKSVTEVDAAFAVNSDTLFAEEMTLIRFEVFGLAWMHELGDKHAAAQSASQSGIWKTTIERISGKICSRTTKPSPNRSSSPRQGSG